MGSLSLRRLRPSRRPPPPWRARVRRDAVRLRGYEIDKPGFTRLHLGVLAKPHSTCLVTGAAGFIGSHLVDRLLENRQRVIGIDDLSLGNRNNLRRAFQCADFTFLEANVNDFDSVLERLRALPLDSKIDCLWHLAANSDIRAGNADPSVDLQRTFLTTFHSIRLMAKLGIRRIAFASSSAIYGPAPGILTEDSGPLAPISNYGAMKLASEGALTAALEQFLEQVSIIRFPNVVGPRATHGVIVDLIAKLRAAPSSLEVLGDGLQGGIL